MVNLWDMSTSDLVFTIFISIIFTWGFGLSIPILIRWLYKEPLSKGWAITLCAVWWVILLIFSKALGSTSKYHGGLLVVTMASYYILRKGSSIKPTEIDSTTTKRCPSCKIQQGRTKSEPKRLASG